MTQDEKRLFDFYIEGNINENDYLEMREWIRVKTGQISKEEYKENMTALFNRRLLRR
jgi:hypothetical protein